MTKTLEQSLDAADKTLAHIIEQIPKLPKVPKLADHFDKIAQFQSRFDHWRHLLQARDAQFAFLSDLESRADANGDVEYGNSQIQFRVVRLLGIQAYLAAQWALADGIAEMAAMVLCSPNANSNRMTPPNLMNSFVRGRPPKQTDASNQSDSAKQSGGGNQTANLAYGPIRYLFGWPVCVSYALRNTFIHDGADGMREPIRSKEKKNDAAVGQINSIGNTNECCSNACANIGDRDGGGFFVGPDCKSAFRVSQNGWEIIERRIDTYYGVDKAYTRLPDSNALSAGKDLRDILNTCAKEMDAALGILLCSACEMAKIHLDLLLDIDSKPDRSPDTTEHPTQTQSAEPI
ncbi:MAG: hypothetical protein FWD57_07765 [Polyangiaceae bacterium]|nr:hypothetical protein [Polyangiaceae bacterium]